MSFRYVCVLFGVFILAGLVFAGSATDINTFDNTKNFPSVTPSEMQCIENTKDLIDDSDINIESKYNLYSDEYLNFCDFKESSLELNENQEWYMSIKCLITYFPKFANDFFSPCIKDLNWDDKWYVSFVRVNQMPSLKFISNGEVCVYSNAKINNNLVISGDKILCYGLYGKLVHFALPAKMYAIQVESPLKRAVYKKTVPETFDFSKKTSSKLFFNTKNLLTITLPYLPPSYSQKYWFGKDKS